MQNLENNNLPIAVKTYLNKYAYRIENLNLKNIFECIIVIPILDEFQFLPNLIDSLKIQQQDYLSKTLFIFVINNSKNNSEEAKKNNRESISFLNKLKNKKEINIGIIDASTEGNELPDKTAGVGLARKIGMDTALCYFNYKSENKKFIVCLDGDCTVSSNYLQELFQNIHNRELKAGYVRYKHNIVDDEEINKAIIIYEIFLRYYVLGLKYASSPYAFHTIGSTMFCDYESYIKIEGMNKRKAAEDFYFMEKLSKVCAINEINSAYVYPSPRPSWRVPFGTGQRVNRFLTKSQNEYLLYSPMGFEILKEWLTVFNNDEIQNSSFYLEKAKLISLPLYDFLIMNNFENSWNKISTNCTKKEQILNQKKIWFDGFRTLKLIHHLRDNQFPLENMFDTLDELFTKIEQSKPNRNNNSIPNLNTQMEYLEILRKLA